MTVDEQPPPAAPPADPSQQALERYLASMRRPRLVYAAAITVAVLVLAGVVAVLWSGSEVAHTTSHPAKAAAPPVALGTPANPLRQAWTTTDRAAIGTPNWVGAVVTYSAHTVRGRNALTGAVTWSYTRSDRTLCQVIQDLGTTVAIYRHGGNCDEVTALDSGSGSRKWTRTLDKDGKPLNGEPAYAVGPYTIMLTTPSVIYAFDPGSGLDRWMFSQPGCRINSAALGSIGALISQTCTAPQCAGLKYCGAGAQLVLRDPTTARSDEDKDKANPDQLKWIRLGLDAVPASADQLVSAVDRASGQLIIFDAGKGTSSTQLPLHPGAGIPAPVTAIATSSAELLWIDATLYAIDLQSQAVTWSLSLPSPPTVTPRGDQNLTDVPDLAKALLVGTAPNAVQEIRGVDGKVSTTYAVGAVPSDAPAFPMGTGFVLAGASTVVYQ